MNLSEGESVSEFPRCLFNRAAEEKFSSEFVCDGRCCIQTVFVCLTQGSADVHRIADCSFYNGFFEHIPTHRVIGHSDLVAACDCNCPYNCFGSEIIDNIFDDYRLTEIRGTCQRCDGDSCQIEAPERIFPQDRCLQAVCRATSRCA